jgi:hypothetical protein
MDGSVGLFLDGPPARKAFGCAEAGGKIYMFGGNNGINNNDFLGDTWVFDPVRIEWTGRSHARFFE